MTLVDQIQYLTQKNGITISYLEKKLGFSNGSIKKWNKNLPSVDKVNKVANYFDVSLDWLVNGVEKKSEQNNTEILSIYNQLSKILQNEVVHYANYLHMMRTNSITAIAKPTRTHRSIPVFNMAASAGFGISYKNDALPFKNIEYDTNILPEATDFGIKLFGDSMEPLLYDDEIAFVKFQNHLEPRDVGIFIVDGKTYCKRFNTANGTLESINPRYKPIPFGGEEDFIIVGKVLNYQISLRGGN